MSDDLEIEIDQRIGSITQYGSQVIEVDNIDDTYHYDTDLVNQTFEVHFLTSKLMKKRVLNNNIDRLKKIFNSFIYYTHKSRSTSTFNGSSKQYPKRDTNRDQYVLFCKKFNYKDMLVNLEFELKYFYVRDRRKVEIENVEYREIQ